MRSRLVLPLLLVALVTACGGSSDSSRAPNPSPAPPQGGTSRTAGTTSATGVHELVALRGNRWSQPDLQVKVGDTVRVTVSDPDVAHNFTVPGVGHSPTMNQGDSFSLRFPKAGTFAFECTFHVSSGMVGKVTVS